MRWRRTSTRSAMGFDPAPLDRCAVCGRRLSPRSPSLWFCAVVMTGLNGYGIGSPCQQLWYANRVGVEPETTHAA